MKSGVQFKIIPGHHGGFISHMCKYIPLTLRLLALTMLLQWLIQRLASLSVRVATGAGTVNQPGLCLYTRLNIFVDCNCGAVKTIPVWYDV